MIVEVMLVELRKYINRVTVTVDDNATDEEIKQKAWNEAMWYDHHGWMVSDFVEQQATVKRPVYTPILPSRDELYRTVLEHTTNPHCPNPDCTPHGCASPECWSR